MCFFLVQAAGIPEFLDPEATRPLAVNPSHGSERTVNRDNGPALVSKVNRKKQDPGEAFDVAALAPRLGPQQRYTYENQKIIPFTVHT